MASLTPQKFVERWQGTTLSERASYQSHFIDLCHMMNINPPGGSGTDREGRVFTFEYSLKKDSGGQGFADVFYENHFAIEYKAAGKYNDLNDALMQLKQYRENLYNPPLLIVTDIANWEIHTNFTNAANMSYTFTNDEITNPRTLRWLHAIFEDPNRLHPQRTSAEVTAEAAEGFKKIADNMRAWEAEPDRIARFLTKIVFCLFAEDVGLLPVGLSGNGIFTELVLESQKTPSNFVPYMEQLFRAMADGGSFLMREIDWFDGMLFENVDVETLEHEAITELAGACRLDWSNIEPAIFGTLFERSLDPSKRSQLGAHYTSRDDILLIVEPVLMQPLRREWEAIRTEAEAVRAKYDQATNKAVQTRHRKELEALREQIIDRVSSIRVLDPACGSGNFLYVSLGLLLDLEKEIVTDPVFVDCGLTIPQRRVHPRQLYGIEINPIAHALTSIVVWIGYIQWQQDNGYVDDRQPILEDLHENVRLMDAIMHIDDDGNVTEPEWETVDVIVGNPPFLGGGKLRGQLGDEYYEKLTKLYDDRIPGFSDLVCYWFEKAREQIEKKQVKRVGLLSTNSIRGGANREVLKRIKDTGDIFMAWSDRDWVLDGAAVRVSMTGFDDGTEDEKVLDGSLVQNINSDLTGKVDVTQAQQLTFNYDLCFMGASPKGPFDIDKTIAEKMLSDINESLVSNNEVVRPVISATDIVRNPRNKWTIDFGLMEEIEAQKYKMPYQYVKEVVYPIRSKNRRKSYAEFWWRYAEARPGMREALKGLSRYIATPGVSKYRIFTWMPKENLCNQGTLVIARDDDYFFGVLHSTFHDLWALRQGTSLGPTPRYTPTTTFETFPFPWAPGQEDTESDAHRAISAIAKTLYAEREAWLNPEDTALVKIKDRTLTNLYNALEALREMGDKPRDMPDKIKPDAWRFAPRLKELHDSLDKAVCDAYGWSHDILGDEEAILRNLLELNLLRAATQDHNS